MTLYIQEFISASGCKKAITITNNESLKSHLVKANLKNCRVRKLDLSSFEEIYWLNKILDSRSVPAINSDELKEFDFSFRKYMNFIVNSFRKLQNERLVQNK